MSDNRGAAYWEGERLIVRMSSLPGCVVAYRASAMDWPKSPTAATLSAAFQFGKDHEQQVIDWWLRETKWEWVADSGQVEVEWQIGSRVTGRGHIDGLATHGPHRALVEVKTLSRDSAPSEGLAALRGSWPSEGLWGKYGWQISAYGHGLAGMGVNVGSVVVLVGWKGKGEGDEGMVVEDIEWVELKIDELPVTRAEVMKRLIEIRRAVDSEGNGDGDGDGDDMVCVEGDWGCAYWELHKKKEVEVGETVFDEALWDAVRAWEEARAEVGEMGKRVDGLKAEVERLLSVHGYVKGKGKGEDRVKWGGIVRVECGADREVIGDKGLVLELVEREVKESTRKAYTMRFFQLKG